MTSGSDWVEQARRLVDAVRAGGPATSPAAADGGGTGAGADCRWCPLCQAAAVIRGERPEVTAALADVLTATAAALRQFAGEPPAGAPRTGEAADDGPVADDGAAEPAVQRIELA
jgi:hypothetical protein